MLKKISGKSIVFGLCIMVLGGWAIDYEIDRYQCSQTYSVEYCKRSKEREIQYDSERIEKARQINDMINSIGR